MPQLDTYAHLNGGKFDLSLPAGDLAALVCAHNYGAVRLISAMVHELRKQNMEHVTQYRADPSTSASSSWHKPEALKSPLADALEEILNKGLFY